MRKKKPSLERFLSWLVGRNKWRTTLNPSLLAPGELLGESASCYFPQSPCGRCCQQSCSWGEEGSASHTHPTRLGHFASTAFSLWTSASGVATPLTVQWLRLHASTGGGTCSIPGWWTKMPHTICGVARKKKNKKPKTKNGCDFDRSCPSPSRYHLELYSRARWAKGTFVKINTG